MFRARYAPWLFRMFRALHEAILGGFVQFWAHYNLGRKIYRAN
jgi:hypothetical protein